MTRARLALLAALAAVAAAAAGAAAEEPANGENGEAEVKVDPFAPKPLAEQYAKNDSSVLHAYTKPAAVTSLSFTYWANEKVGVDMTAGKKLVFDVPAEFQATRLIDSITLVHRKENSGAATAKLQKIKGVWNGKDVEYEWDSEPCYFAVSCRDADTKRWETWRGPHGRTKRGEPRPYGDPARDTRRYSEPRDEKNPDWDVLPDCAKWLGARRCDLISVENVGGGGLTAKGRVHGVRVQYRPFRGHVLRHHDQVHHFTRGTVFADPEITHRLVPHFAGGVNLEASEVNQKHTVYPGAEPIGNEEVDKELSETFRVVTPWLRVTRGGLVVRLRPNHLFAGCDVAVGDAKFDARRPAEGQRDGDGQIGAQGGSRIDALMRHPNSTGTGANFTEIPGTTHWMVREFDVQSASVLSVDPPRMDDIRIPPALNATDPWSSSFVRLDAGVDPSYIMAVRCRYYRNGTVTFPPPPKANGTKPGAPAGAAAQSGGSAPTTNSTAAASNSSASASASASASGTSTVPAPPAASGSNSTSASASGAPAPSNSTEAAAQAPAAAPVANTTGGAPAAAASNSTSSSTSEVA